jgi:hypothetical protein
MNHRFLSTGNRRVSPCRYVNGPPHARKARTLRGVHTTEISPGFLQRRKHLGS